MVLSGVDRSDRSDRSTLADTKNQHFIILIVAEPPKRLGPGALIFVAKQLGPQLARTGSSSSEALIKATLFQDRADNTHTKMSPEITTQNISYISE